MKRVLFLSAVMAVVLLAAGTARADRRWSFQFHSHGGYPLPHYYYGPPVYYAPPPAYCPPPVYVERYYAPPPYHYRRPRMYFGFGF